MTRYDYAVHWYALLFPELPADDYEKLKEDIRSNGQLQPIVIAKKDDGNSELLDGRHRIKICQELGITPYTVLFRDVHNVRSDMTEVDFIDSVNLHRRHMTDLQRAVLAVARSQGLEKAAKEQQKRKSVLVKSPKQKPLNVRKELAKQTGLPENKIRVAQELTKRDPQAAEQLTQGKISDKEARKKLEPAVKPFQEKAALAELDHATERITKAFLSNSRDLAPIVRLLRNRADYLEGFQKKKSAELQKKIDTLGVQVGAP
jgi:ParB-like chromosome segregation protein Spo0J